VRLVCFILVTTGCTLLFDPSGVVPTQTEDLAAPADQQFAVDDLAAPEDLAVVLEDLAPPPDLAEPDLLPPIDLLPADLRPCVPAVFLGFFDGGSPNPLPCNCGCELDSLTNPATWPAKFNHAISIGWSESVDGGALTVAAPGAQNGEMEVFNSPGKFYLAGDFDLRLDYDVDVLPNGGFVQLVVVGSPVPDGGNQPYGVAQTYQSTASMRFSLVADDRSFDVYTLLDTGTLRIRRTAGRLCASVAGEQLCHEGTSAGNVWLQVSLPVYNAACGPACAGSNCCVVKTRVSRLRVTGGQVVLNP
jgi:hypothetical protein